MARITVEDCLEKVNNRFLLVLITARRARELSIHNAHSELDWENDKATVLALREVAAGLVDESILHKTTAVIGHRPVRNPIEMLAPFPDNEDL